MRMPWWGVLCWMTSCAFIFWLFDHFGKFELARPALYCIGMLGIVFALKWNLRRHVWFWITMIVIILIHILLILSVPWTTKWVPAIVIVPFGIADVYAMIWIL